MHQCHNECSADSTVLERRLLHYKQERWKCSYGKESEEGLGAAEFVPQCTGAWLLAKRSNSTLYSETLWMKISCVFIGSGFDGVRIFPSRQWAAETPPAGRVAGFSDVSGFFS